jgi:hypothetical protein
MSDKKEDDCCNVCELIWHISLQFATWFIVIWCAVMITYRMLHWAEITILGLVYLTYVIYFLCYKSCTYLNNNFKKLTLHDYLEELFYTPPLIEFQVQSYHYETRTSYSKSGGTKSRRVRVVTHSESENFNYYTGEILQEYLN